jgi:hypothetical protein
MRKNHPFLARSDDEIAALARERARTGGKTFAQAFTEALTTEHALRRRLAEERRIAATPAPDPEDERGRRVASLILRRAAYDLRQADPTLTEAQAFTAALAQAGPTTRRLLAGRG